MTQATYRTESGRTGEIESASTASVRPEGPYLFGCSPAD